MSNEVFVAVVQKVIMDGKHGPYAKATEDNLGTITFSLDGSVWQEMTLPEKGDVVVLEDVRRKHAGWRANSSRFFRPSDKQTGEGK